MYSRFLLVPPVLEPPRCGHGCLAVVAPSNLIFMENVPAGVRMERVELCDYVCVCVFARTFAVMFDSGKQFCSVHNAGGNMYTECTDARTPPPTNALACERARACLMMTLPWVAVCAGCECI